MDDTAFLGLSRFQLASIVYDAVEETAGGMVLVNAAYLTWPYQLLQFTEAFFRTRRMTEAGRRHCKPQFGRAAGGLPLQ